MDRLTELIKQIDAYFTGKPEVLAGYVFGSVANNRQRAGSDLDIAILLQYSLGKNERGELLDRLFIDLSNLLRQDIHLLLLNDSSLVIRMQVLYRGVLAHVKDRTGLAEFRTASFSMYADFAPTLRGLQERLVEGFGEEHGQ